MERVKVGSAPARDPRLGVPLSVPLVARAGSGTRPAPACPPSRTKDGGPLVGRPSVGAAGDLPAPGASTAVIHLDTSFLVRALVRDSPQDGRLRAWLGAGEPLGMSAIAWAEFLCGPVEAPLLELVAQIVPRRIPFTEDEAALAAELFNASGRLRGSLADCMIAATAICGKAALATENAADFRRFRTAGLQIATA